MDTRQRLSSNSRFDLGDQFLGAQGQALSSDGRLRVGLKSLAEIRVGGSEVHNSFQRVQSGNHGALARQEEGDAKILAELMLA